MKTRLALAALLIPVTFPAAMAAPVPLSPPAKIAPLHLRLTKSEPAKDVVVAAPSVIRLWFSMPPELAVTTVRVTGAGGESVALSAVRRAAAAGAPVEADVREALAPGRYTVSWKTSSRDGHPMKGDFSFTVRTGAK
ncbi:MAG: copper resistance protein CopC [Gemmatimonadota bacterium]